MVIKALIQVRMNSSRYPGKVLAPLGGKPLITRVMENVIKAVDPTHMVVLTSFEASDDPIVSFVRERQVKFYRGPLDNVFKRFRDCLLVNECDYFFRVCGDSPFLDPSLFRHAVSLTANDQMPDLVTNTFPRTFPAGKTVELIKREAFLAVDPEQLSAEEKEHATRYFYNHNKDYEIINIELGKRSYKSGSYTVDTVDDLKRMEQNLEQLEKEVS